MDKQYRQMVLKKAFKSNVKRTALQKWSQKNAIEKQHSKTLLKNSIEELR
jgi:hypothetical protein